MQNQLQSKKVGMLDSLAPKTSFAFGFVTGMAAILLLTSAGIIRSGNAAVGVTPTPTVLQPTAANPTPSEPVPAGKVPEITNKDHIRGDKNAKVTFVEYSDYECPFCQRFHPTMLKIMDEYEGRVRWVYRHFPLSFHANAQKEAEAAECANELGGNDAFWKYTDAIFERSTAGGTGFALEKLTPLAEELGMNGKKFKECLDSGRYAKHVGEDMAGGSSAGVTGTPGSFIIDAQGNAQLISGAMPYETIKPMLDAALAK